MLRGLGHRGRGRQPDLPDRPSPMRRRDMRLPLWHVDLYRIEHAGELDELGLDEARAEAALLIEWPERLAPAVARGAPADPRRRRGRRARLDSRGAARLGRAMAAPMIPPPHAPDFLAAHGWAGARDQAAGRRRQLPPLFPGRSRRRAGRC